VRFVRLLIEYEGTNYHGWQEQPAALTLQGVLRKTIESITSEPVRLTGASRTDAGVHALGQVAVFPTISGLPVETIQRALNAKLPEDIRILSADEASEGFHPRYDAVKKSYFYLISNSRLRSVFLHRYLWQIIPELDIQKMQKAADLLLGEHDFSAFRGAGCGAKTTVRTIYSLEISRTAEISFMTAPVRGDFIKIRAEANAFLRHMVRNIVGTLVDVGAGQTPIDEFQGILESGERTKAGPTAAPQGLFLEQITY